MKNTHNRILILLSIIFLCLSSGIAMLLFGLLRTAIPHLRLMLNGEIPFDITHDAVLFALAMLILLLALIPGAAVFWYGRFQMLHPLRRAEDFLEQLSRGETPPPLTTGKLGSRRMQTLFSELNLLRDRLRSLSARLENGLAHEAELRREMEKYDRMQIETMARLLPETRRSIGVIKGLLLGSKDCTDEAERYELGDRAFHRTTALSREIERLVDFSRLGLARWNRRPSCEEFDAAVFMRELVNRSKVHLQARNISFESGFSGRSPSRFKVDRDLLYQLLSIMIRAVGRLSASGSTLKFVCRGDGRKAEFEVSCPVCNRLDGGFAERLSEVLDGGGALENIPVEVLALGVAQDIARRIGCLLQARPAEGGADLVMALPPELCVFDVDKIEFSSFEEHGGKASVVERRSGSAKDRPPRTVLLWSEDRDESLAVSAVLRKSGIEVRCFSELGALETALVSEHCDGVILSPGSFGADPCELVFRLRRLVGRPNLAIAVMSPQMSDDVYSRLGDLDRVSVLIMPINYEMLADAFGGRS